MAAEDENNADGQALTPQQSHHYYDGNPLAHQWTNASEALGPDAAFFQPGNFRPIDRKRANPVPLGLSGFALTTFVLSIANLGVRGVTVPNVFVAPSLAYGGLIQLLAGMWLMGEGNAFGAWALSSYGGFWISLGITFTPGGFGIAAAYGGMTKDFYTALGFYVYGWFVFTVLVWLATLRATLLLNLLLLCVWLAFLMLATGYVDAAPGATATPNMTLIQAGGGFGIVAAFIAWWIMFAGVMNKENSWVVIPTFEFPWAPEARTKKGKPEAVGVLKERFSERETDVERQA